MTDQYLNDNALSGSLATQLGALTALVYQSLEDNNLSGSLPTQLGALTALVDHFLGYNDLSGSLATQLGALTALTYQNFIGNDLSGSLPTQLGALTALKSLHFEYNDLSGILPTQLGVLTANLYQYFQGNGLSGSLPTQLAALTMLGYQNLNGNHLSGSLPTQFGVLKQVVDCSVDVTNRYRCPAIGERGQVPAPPLQKAPDQITVTPGGSPHYVTWSLACKGLNRPIYGGAPFSAMVSHMPSGDCNLTMTDMHCASSNSAEWSDGWNGAEWSAPSWTDRSYSMPSLNGTEPCSKRESFSIAESPPPPLPPSPPLLPPSPPSSPEVGEAREAQGQWVPWIVLPLCMLLAAIFALRYSRVSRNAANLRLSRDRANFDLRLLSHQQQITHRVQPRQADDNLSLPDSISMSDRRCASLAGATVASLPPGPPSSSAASSLEPGPLPSSAGQPASEQGVTVREGRPSHTAGKKRAGKDLRVGFAAAEEAAADVPDGSLKVSLSWAEADRQFHASAAGKAYAAAAKKLSRLTAPTPPAAASPFASYSEQAVISPLVEVSLTQPVADGAPERPPSTVSARALQKSIWGKHLVERWEALTDSEKEKHMLGRPHNMTQPAAPAPAPFPVPAPAIEQSLEPLACAEADQQRHTVTENAACSMQHAAANLPAPGADPGVKLVDLALLAELGDDEAVAALANHVVANHVVEVARTSK